MTWYKYIGSSVDFPSTVWKLQYFAPKAIWSEQSSFTVTTGFWKTSSFIVLTVSTHPFRATSGFFYLTALVVTLEFYVLSVELLVYPFSFNFSCACLLYCVSWTNWNSWINCSASGFILFSEYTFLAGNTIYCIFTFCDWSFTFVFQRC